LKEYALSLTSSVNIFDHAFSRDFELVTQQLTKFSAVLSCFYDWRERGGREGEKEREPTERVIRWCMKLSSSFSKLLYEKSEFTLWRFGCMRILSYCINGVKCIQSETECYSAMSVPGIRILW